MASPSIPLTTRRPAPPGAGGTRPDAGFAGIWDVGGTTIGRLYFYAQSGTYYLVWTFGNDSYEASFGEGFVVVASGPSAASLST